MDNEAVSRQDVALGGYWRRFWVFMIDMFLLGVVGNIIGYTFQNRLIALGDWGRFIGWAIFLVYFLPLESAWGGGRSLGKRMCDLKVVGANNEPPSVLRNLARTMVLAALFFLNGTSFAGGGSDGLTWWTIASSFLFCLIVFGGIAAFAYLWLFTRKSKQLLHDLASGTVVVRASSERAPIVATARIHKKFVIGILCVLGIILPLLGLYAAKQIHVQNAFSKMVAAQKEIQKFSEIRSASVVENRTHTVISTKSVAPDTISMNIVAILNQIPADPKQESVRLASKAIPFLKIADDMPVAVTVRWGYDLGLARMTHFISSVHTAREWMEAVSSGRLPDEATLHSKAVSL